MSTDTKPRSRRCNRCVTGLILTDWGGKESVCATCGNRQYIQVIQQSRDDIMGSATRTIARYAGDHPALTETLCTIELVRVRLKVTWRPECPFCQQHMEPTSLSSKRKDMSEERFKCPQDHRISLLRDSEENIWWK